MGPGPPGPSTPREGDPSPGVLPSRRGDKSGARPRSGHENRPEPVVSLGLSVRRAALDVWKSVDTRRRRRRRSRQPPGRASAPPTAPVGTGCQSSTSPRSLSTGGSCPGRAGGACRRATRPAGAHSAGADRAGSVASRRKELAPPRFGRVRSVSALCSAAAARGARRSPRQVVRCRANCTRAGAYPSARPVRVAAEAGDARAVEPIRRPAGRRGVGRRPPGARAIGSSQTSIPVTIRRFIADHSRLEYAVSGRGGGRAHVTRALTAAWSAARFSAGP
jgi:hypothetical protein